MSDTEQEIVANISDADLLAGAFGSEPETATHEPEVIEAPVNDRPRDEHGRFASAPKVEEPAATVQTEAQAETQKEDAHVPSWRLREVSEAKRAAERRAEENERKARELEAMLQNIQRQQQPQQPQVNLVDALFGDKPEEALTQVVNPMLEPFQRMAVEAKTRADRLEAAFQYTREEVEAAEKAFNEAAASGQMDRNEWARIQNSPNPFAAAVEWHKRNTVLSEVGTDPNAWLEKKLEERLSDPAFLAKAIERVRGGQAPQGGSAPSTVTRLPPSLNRASGSAARGSEDLDDSDKGLLKSFLPR